MKSGNPKSDNLVSLSFVGIAAVMMLVAFMTYPWITPPQLNDKMGKALFDWESLSADKVGTLEIVRYDSQSDQLIDFRVENHRNYTIITGFHNVSLSIKVMCACATQPLDRNI